MAAAAFAIAAFGLGAWRAASSPVVEDSGFRLLRSGRAFLAGPIDGLTRPPGCAGDPPLGAVATFAATLAPGGLETALRLPGSFALAASAALLAAALLRLASPSAAVLGVAFLLGPPLFVTATVGRPDAGLGGTLLLAARLAMRSEPRRPRAVALASAAAFTSPLGFAALAAAITRLRPAERRRPSTWLAPSLALAYAWFVTGSLPPGSRGAFASSLLGAPSPVHAARDAIAALAPSFAFVAARFVHRIPDPRAVGRVARPLLVAFAAPLLVYLATDEADRRARNAARAESARGAQLGALLAEDLPAGAAIAASPAGALAVYTDRPVVSPRPGAGALADAYVFARALAPSTRAELAAFEDPRFLREMAPVLVRRGARLELQDAVWRRRPPRAGEARGEAALPADYLFALRAGWEAHAREDTPEAARAFAAAAAAEPEGLGIAHEWAGLMAEELGQESEAERAFEEAVRRDPATARARASLADRAISRGALARADTLLAEAIAWNPRDAATWGTIARLAAAAGDLSKGSDAAQRAIELDPGEARHLLNAGSILWARGEFDAAKERWRLAVGQDPRLARFLGTFETAAPATPAPPLFPLFTPDSFEPGEPPRP